MESTMPLLVQYELHQRLYNNVLEGFTDEESNRRPFINHHQAYHIGQAAILRKVFGKKPMSFQ